MCVCVCVCVRTCVVGFFVTGVNSHVLVFLSYFFLLFCLEHQRDFFFFNFYVSCVSVCVCEFYLELSGIEKGLDKGIKEYLIR